MRHLAGLALSLGLAFAGAAQASTFVSAITSGTTDLGLFAPGTYLITASGVAGLVGAPGSGLDINPDGSPNAVTFPGAGFFLPDGSASAGGEYGPGGSG